MNTVSSLSVSLPKTTLRGWQLWLGRLLWLVMTVLVLLTLSEIWPENHDVTYTEYVVTLTRTAVSAFMAYVDFVRFISLLESFSALTALLMGFVVFCYKSDDKMGLFVSAFLILMAPWFLSSNLEMWRLPAWVPFGSALTWMLSAAMLSSLVLFFYLFPNGSFVSRWTRWTAVFTFVIFGVFMLSDYFHISSPSENLWLIYTTTFFGSLVVASVAQFYRYRTTTDLIQRQQMKWVIFAFAAFIVLLLFNSFGLLWGRFTWASVAELLAGMLVQWFIPLAIGFSILRYRLWEIDLLINRTLVYGILTALVIGLYVLVVGLAGSLFRFGDNTLATVLATGLVAVLFEPLRRRLQRSVNRLMYGEQDDPVALLRKLGNRLAETAVPAETVPALVETIATTLKLPYVAIITTSEQWVTGQESFKLLSFPLLVQNEEVGQLVISTRSGGEKFSGTEMKLLADIARQAGTAVYAARLTADLQHARERLIIAREEERRRLRRDLHDGLGPQLATLTIKAGAAQNLLKSNPEQAEKLLGEINAEAQTAVQEIRRVVEGLRPSTLDQLGLLSALQEFIAQNGNGRVQFTLQAPEELPPLPAAVEVAAYRIITEAISNTMRHARAQTCHIQLTINGAMALQVQDNGCGLPIDVSHGVGLHSMQERAEELGGAFSIKSISGQGTTIYASLPLTDTL
ncbi:MAG: GAF domain-containing sensor histidine kinase [Chloroflexota bacterium]